MTRRSFALAVSASAFAAPSARGAAKPFNLRYGPRVGWIGNIPVADQIQMYADAGFTAFEHNGLPRSSNAEIEALRKKRDSLKMSMGTFVINSGGWKTSALVDKQYHAKFLEDVRRGVEIHSIMENEVATVTSGVAVANLTEREQTANCIEGLKRAAEIVDKSKLMLVLEPLNIRVDHAGYFVVFSDHAAEIISAVNHPRVKILFDIYHQQISEGNVINHIRKYWDLIGYFQTGDVPGRKEPGTGETNYRNVFRAIHEKGYKGILGLEHGMSMPGKAGFAKVVEAYRQADLFL